MRQPPAILNRFSQERFSILPTPLHKLEKISTITGYNIYCKRDDLSGFAFGGNKTRKLDFLIADAKQKGADAIIAVGAVQSNFCRLASAAGKVCGFDVHLVLGGRQPEKISGNLLLDYIFDSKIHFVDSPDWESWENEAKILEHNLIAKGKKVYFLPIGGSTPIGALGYVSAFYEILNGCESLGIEIDTIIHATSSGGTQAGLIIGKKLTNWKGKIIGIAVAKNRTILKDEIFKLALDAGSLFGVTPDLDDVIIDDSYKGEGYGLFTPECQNAINLFAQKEGIVLDRVYTGKAAAGLLDYARQKKFLPDQNILFIHTGGNVEIFS